MHSAYTVSLNKSELIKNNKWSGKLRVARALAELQTEFLEVAVGFRSRNLQPLQDFPDVAADFTAVQVVRLQCIQPNYLDFDGGSKAFDSMQQNIPLALRSSFN